MAEELLDVGTDELDRLKIGKETNGLYWDGKRVQTESVVVLSPSQGFWALAVAIAAIVAAIASVVSAYADWHSMPREEKAAVVSEPAPTDCPPGPEVCPVEY